MSTLMKSPFPPLSLQGRGVAVARAGLQVFSGLDFRVSSGEVLAITGPTDRENPVCCGVLPDCFRTLQVRLWSTVCARIYIVMCIKRTCVISVIQTASSLCSRCGEPVLLQHAARSFLVPDMHNGSGRLLCSCRAFRNSDSSVISRSAAAGGAGVSCDLPAQLWLLDEPTTALDRSGIQTLETLIQDHCTVGGAVVMSTHEAQFSFPNTLELGACESDVSPPHPCYADGILIRTCCCHYPRYSVGSASWR